MPAGADKPLVLGSASPRRHRLLAGMGIPFEVVIPDVDEAQEAISPDLLVRENALRKHAWCRERYADRQILAADTIVVLDERPLLKPETLEQARGFFHSMSGRAHHVLTAVAFGGAGGLPRVAVERSDVIFKKLDEAAIDAYFAFVDPLDKAGGYDIGQHPELIIESFTGSRTNIEGLPVEVVAKLLRGRRDISNVHSGVR